MRGEARWWLRVGPVESSRVWAMVRSYLEWELELGGRVAAVWMTR